MLIRFDKRRTKKLRKLAAQPDVDLWALDKVPFSNTVLGVECGFRRRLKNPSLSTDLCYTLVVSIFGLDDCIPNDLIGCPPWKSGTNDEIELVRRKLLTSALKWR